MTLRRRIEPHQLLLTLAFVLGFAAYYGTLSFEFVHDDRAQIVHNPQVHSWQYVPRYFSEHVWASILPDTIGNYYRPLFLLWLRVNDALFGLRPQFWHLTSILCHLAVALLVYFLAVRLLRDRTAAAVAALIFAVHPVHLDSVAWISGVTDPLMTLFLLSSFLCYLKGRETTDVGKVWQAGSLCLYAAATLTKETALVFPGLVFIYEWAFTDVATYRVTRFRNAALRSVPFVIATGLYLLLRIRIIGAIGHPVTSASLSTILFTLPGVFWDYSKLLFWPASVNPFHASAYVTHPDWPNFIAPMLAILAVAGVIYLLSRQFESRLAGFAAAWLILPMVPLLDLRVLPMAEFVHDRYLYLPSVGLAILAALAVKLALRWRPETSSESLVQVLVPVVLGAILMVTTVLKSPVYANDLLYYSRGISVEPDNRDLLINFANVLTEHGRFDEAISVYNRVLAKTPGYWSVNYNLGRAYFSSGKLDLAELYLKRAVVINAASGAQLLLGGTYIKEHRLEEAAAVLKDGIERNPVAPEYHFCLGLVLKLQNDLPGALEQFKAETAIEPDPVSAAQVAEISTQLQH